jgi:hypothetical protein
MPPWLKINIDSYVDDAAAVSLNVKRLFADVQMYGRVFNRNTNEVSPAAGSSRWVSLAPGMLG